MLDSQPPITDLPEDYREVYYLTIEDQNTLLQLNILSVALLVPFIALMYIWQQAVLVLRGPLGGLENLPGVLLWIFVLGVLPLHEWIHGLAIQRVGYTPRYGAKYVELGPIKLPYVLYATTDDGLFLRDQFITVALAPVVVITLLGMVLMLVVPDVLSTYIAAAVVINGSGAVGDLWMTVVARRYPPDALVRDEADSIRIYTR
jgi:hypothetical protein